MTGCMNSRQRPKIGAAILNVKNEYRENSGAMPINQPGVVLCANQIEVQRDVARFQAQVQPQIQVMTMRHLAASLPRRLGGIQQLLHNRDKRSS